MEKDKVFIIYITTGNRDEARAIGLHLVERRLAACVNVLPVVDSFYHWEGGVVEDQEAVLLVKTVERLVDTLIETVRSRHSYQVPAILAIPAERVEVAYHGWLVGEVAPRDDKG